MSCDWASLSSGWAMVGSSNLPLHSYHTFQNDPLKLTPFVYTTFTQCVTFSMTH